MKSLNAALLQECAQNYGTPFYLYDWQQIVDRVERLRAFDVIRYAQKANSNTHLLRRLRQLGVAVDAVSSGEIARALAAGYARDERPRDLVFTADVITEECLATVVSRKLPVNAGSIDMLDQLGQATNSGHPVWLRINPGFGHGHSRKTNTGGPWSKHGIWHDDAEHAMQRISGQNLALIGLHMHIGSGTDFAHLKQVCDAMVAQVQKLRCDIEAISAGGGLPIPYQEGASQIDPSELFDHWNRARMQIQQRLGHDVAVEIEPGRYLVAESGFLVAEIRATKTMGENQFALCDAGFDNLVRPSMYGAYHHISLVRSGKLVEGAKTPWVVAGPLCESGDVFTQGEGGVVTPRALPTPRVGDLVVFHDAGAYASSMASNYNSRLLAPEILQQGAEVEVIRRRQTIDELLALEEDL